MRRVACLVLVLSLLVSTCSAITPGVFAQQWYQQYVGHVKDVRFTTGHRIAVLSDGAVAALSTQSADFLLWRQAFPEGEKGLAFDVAKGAVVTLSDNAMLRSWSTANGTFQWEALLNPLGSRIREADIIIAESLQLTREQVVVLADGVVQGRQLSSGQVSWELLVEKGAVWSKLSLEGDSVCAVGHSQTRASTQCVALQTGKATHSASVRAQSSVWDSSLAGGRVLLAVDSSLHTHVSSGAKSVSHSATLSHKPHSATLLTHRSLAAHAAIHWGESVQFVTADTESLKVLSTVAGAAGSPPVVSSIAEASGQFYSAVLLQPPTENSWVLQLFAMATGKPTQTAYLTLAQCYPSPTALWIDVSGSGSSLQARVLIQYSDDALRLAHFSAAGLKEMWVREEGLGSLVDAQFVELPPNRELLRSLKDEFSRQQSIVTAPFHRLQSQVAQVVSALNGLATSLSHFVAHGEWIYGTSTESASLPLTRDLFGLRKLVIGLNARGAAFALHSSSGELLWKLHTLEHAGLKPASLNVKQLFVMRASSESDPEVGVFLASESAHTLVLINALSGKVLDVTSGASAPLQTVLVPAADVGKRSAIAVLLHALSYSVLPNTPEAQQLVAASRDLIRVYTVDSKDSVVTGYALGAEDKAQLVWKFSLPSGQRLLSAVRSPAEKIQSSARVLGDRTALMKFVTPNALLIHASASETDLLHVYLVDLVKGDLLYQTHHRGGNGHSVAAVKAEHWFAYTYRNTKSHRLEVVATECFHPAKPEWSYSALIPRLVLPPASSALPKCLSQAYTLPFGSVRVFGVTRTHAGITPRQVLAGMSSGRLLAIDKHYLDPRRPMREAVTEFDKEEGLWPYNSTIAPHPRFVLSHNHSIAHLRTIVTAPAYLESTSLIFAYGLDLFYTPTTPAGTFDLLNPDFSRTALVGTVVLIILLALGAMYLAKRSALNVLWK